LKTKPVRTQSSRIPDRHLGPQSLKRDREKNVRKPNKNLAALEYFQISSSWRVALLASYIVWLG
jgi:hypothetical protein